MYTNWISHQNSKSKLEQFVGVSESPKQEWMFVFRYNIIFIGDFFPRFNRTFWVVVKREIANSLLPKFSELSILIEANEWKLSRERYNNYLKKAAFPWNK